MAKEDKEKLEIKNWFKIQWVKVKQVIKEHKYMSMLIGFFIISSIVAVIIYASDDDIYAGKVVATSSGNVEVTSTANADTASTKEVKGFSTVIYDIPYELKIPEEEPSSDVITRSVKVTASLDKDVDASLLSMDSNVSYSVDTSGEKQVLTLYDYGVVGQSNRTKVYMNIYNVNNETVINPTITVCDSASTSENEKCFSVTEEQSKVTVKNNKEITLTPKTVVGIPYNSGEEDSGRYVPFGIAVGIDKNEVCKDDGNSLDLCSGSGSLEGIYFNPDVTLGLSAVSYENGDSSSLTKKNIELISDKNDYHGIYSSNTKGKAKIYFSSSFELPFSPEGDQTDTTIYNPGTITTYESCNGKEELVCKGSSDKTYKLEIKGIKTNGRYVINNNKQDLDKSLQDILGKVTQESDKPNNAKGNLDYLALGTYYVTGKVENDNKTKLIGLNALYLGAQDSQYALSYYSGDTQNITAIKSSSARLAKENRSELSDVDAIAYGEDIVLQSKMSYKYINVDDKDSNKYSLTGILPVAAMKFDGGASAEFDMIEYHSDLAANPYYLTINGTSENLEDYNVKVTYVGCNDLKTCSLSDNEGSTYESYDEYIEAKESSADDSPIYLSYVKYEISNVSQDTDVDFRIKLVAGTNNKGTIKANVKTTFSYQDSTDDYQNEVTIKVVPYKSSATVNIDGNGDDVTINLSNKSSSTIAIYPKVDMPANLINTNTVPVELKGIRIEISLPEYVSYVSNNNYNYIPDFDDKKLIYELTNVKINEFISPIYFDVKYALEVPSNTEYQIGVKITPDININGVSEKETQETFAKIRFFNTEPYSYASSTDRNVVSKDEEFTVVTELYNRSTTNHENLELIYVLPYNDKTNSSFSGTYSIDLSQTANVMCTDASYDVLGNTTNLVNEGVVSWQECQESISNESGITAIKISGITLGTDEESKSNVQSFVITPEDNNFADNYVIKSYIKDNESIKPINSVQVTVESTKIMGTVWEDFNGDGIMTVDESKIPDVELSLYDSQMNEQVSGPTYSDKNGAYSFDIESPGEVKSYYVVANYNSLKYSLTQHAVGNDKSANSSFCLTSGDSCSSQVESEEETLVARTENIEVSEDIKSVSDINLGLSPKKEYSINLNKYITGAEVTNALGIKDVKNYGKVSLAKLDVKDIGNVSIKVTYTIEIENKGHYPGYVYKVKDIIPDGMEFNDSYAENASWVLTDEGYLENTSLANVPIKSGEAKYLTISFDLTRKEAGSFVNYAMVEDEDLAIFTGTAAELMSGVGTNDLISGGDTDE